MLEQRLEAGLFVLGTFVIFSYFLIFSVGTVFSYYLIVSMGTMFSYFLRCSYMFSYFLIFSLLPTLYFELYFKISLCGSFTKLKMSGLRIITTFPPSLQCQLACCLNFDNIETTGGCLGSLVTKVANNTRHKTTRKLAIYANYNKKHETQFGEIRASSSLYCIVSKLGDAIASNLDSFHLSEVCFRPALDGLAKGWKGWAKVRDKK